MTTKDGFDRDDPLPLFSRPDEPEPGIGSDKASISSRFVMTSALVATATAIGISILSVRNPVTLFSDLTASVESSAPQPGNDEPMPSIQSAVTQLTADVGATRTAQDTPTPTSEISVAEPAGQLQAENSGASSEALFREFQTWRAEQRARDLAKPAQDDSVPITKDTRKDTRGVAPQVQKQRSTQTKRVAQADIIRHVRKRRANTKQRIERTEGRLLQDARAQTQPVQNPEPPSFLERLNPFAAGPTRR